MEDRIKRLIRYADELMTTKDKATLYKKYKEDIDSVTPADVFAMQSRRLEGKMTHEEGLEQVGMLINAFHRPLSEYRKKHAPSWTKGGFLDGLDRENEELYERLLALQPLIRQMDRPDVLGDIREKLEELGAYEAHMKKIEHILFPILEQADARYEGTSLMWSMHDRVRQSRKKLLACMEAESSDRREMTKELGILFVSLSGLRTMQSLLLLPCAAAEITPDKDRALLDEGKEYGWSWISAPCPGADKPEKKPSKSGAVPPEEQSNNPGQTSQNKGAVPADGCVDLGTGELHVDELIGIFSALPVDLTFVNADDKVAFFSRPKDRIFPRSISVIGRDVRKCHPAGSVHIVEDILAGFKSGKRNEESFWIQMHGKFLLIRYFAIRDENGRYMGTLEVSQEISDIQNLEGEKRLLDRK